MARDVVLTNLDFAAIDVGVYGSDTSLVHLCSAESKRCVGIVLGHRCKGMKVDNVILRRPHIVAISSRVGHDCGRGPVIRHTAIIHNHRHRFQSVEDFVRDINLNFRVVEKRQVDL